jgi:hypothetical protein
MLHAKPAEVASLAIFGFEVGLRDREVAFSLFEFSISGKWLEF